MAYASKRFSITVSTLALILALPGVSVAQDNERIDLLRDEYENASSHTIDISIPAAPGLVLAGVTADSQVGHNLGSDLSYDFATTQSGGLAGALTLRPYWTFMRPPPTGEAPEQVGDFIHILRRTQVSAAFGQREIGGDDRAVAGLGVVFYP